MVKMYWTFYIYESQGSFCQHKMIFNSLDRVRKALQFLCGLQGDKKCKSIRGDKEMALRMSYHAAILYKTKKKSMDFYFKKVFHSFFKD